MGRGQAEPVEGTIGVDTPYRDNRVLRMQLIDRHGRALASRDYEAPEKEVRFSLPTRASMPGYLAVEAVLVEGEEPLTYAYENYTNVKRHQRDFNLVMWGRLYAPQYLDVAEEWLARSGVTSRLETSEVPWGEHDPRWHDVHSLLQERVAAPNVAGC